MAILYVGIDLAKNVFAVNGVNEQGKPALGRPSVRGSGNLVPLELQEVPYTPKVARTAPSSMDKYNVRQDPFVQRQARVERGGRWGLIDGRDFAANIVEARGCGQVAGSG